MVEKTIAKEKKKNNKKKKEKIDPPAGRVNKRRRREARFSPAMMAVLRSRVGSSFVAPAHIYPQYTHTHTHTHTHMHQHTHAHILSSSVRLCDDIQ